MARGKYEARKRGTATPSAEVSGGVGPSVAVSSALQPTAVAPRQAGGKAEPPVLGIVVMSSWGWRIMAVAVMVAIGLSVTFLLDGHTAIGGLWVFIALAWGFFTYRLWRMHLSWDLGR